MAFQGKKLINDRNDVVTEFIEGLVETCPGLQYLDGFPQASYPTCKEGRKPLRFQVC